MGFAFDENRAVRFHGHDNSMGFVRYCLAITVFIAHFNIVFGTSIYLPVSSYDAVGGFFAMSGFLVYKSYLKSSGIKEYLGRRARRILPPYLFIVLLCAFAMVALSTLSAKDYFFNAGWVKYLVSNVCFLNFLEPELPGVFRELPVTAVNGSLWTMKIEVLLYLSVPVVAWFVAWMHRRNGKDNKTAVFMAIYICSMIYRLVFSYLYHSHGEEIYNIMSRQVFGQLMYFYAGVLIYFNYDRFMKYRLQILAACFVLVCLKSFIPCYTVVVSPVVVASFVLLCSSVNYKPLAFFNRDNISYDIYLFHFPIILVVYSFTMDYNIGNAMALLISSVLTVALGCVSWFFIGKPFMYGGRR